MISNMLEDTSLQEFSYNQKRVWNAEVNQFYHQIVLEFTRNVHKDALLKAIRLVIRKHEVLSYQLINNENEKFPLQKISNESDITFYERGLEHEEEILKQLDVPYISTTDHPIQFGVITKDQNVIRLHIRLYALFGDVYSSRLLISELNSALEDKKSYSQEETPNITYSAYSKWYNTIIEESDKDAINFWKSYGHQPDKSVLPFIKNNGKKPFVPKRQNIDKIQGVRLKQIQEFCIDNKISLSAFLFSEFVDYLQRFTENEITVGYYPLERNYEELNETFGLINHVIPIKVISPENLTKAEKIRHIQEKIEEVKLWSDYYITKENQSFNTTNFSTSFEFVKVNKSKNKELIVKDILSIQDVFELKISCIEYSDHIAVDLSYDSEKIDTKCLKIITAQLQGVFANLSENTTLISEYEKNRIHLNNDTNISFDTHADMVGFFQEQVSKYPEKTAVVCDNIAMTYQELDILSNQLANCLIHQFGTQKGDAVCLLMDPSINFIISLFGTWKAGAYYIPLDHNYPEERIAYILEDSTAKVIISDSKEKQLDTLNIPILCPDDPQILQYSETSPNTKYKSTDLVYCIYTSGSTGKPKGCLINHKNLLNYIQWANQYYFGEDEGGNWGLITSISFDLTITSIFTSLTRGKKLYIGDPNKSSVELLKESFSNPDVDTLKLTPSHLSLLKEMNIKETTIRTIICGGEQLKKSQIKNVKDMHPEIRIYNEYGPTEATVGCVATEVSDADDQILIGKPIANTKIHIVDNQHGECAIGVAGELIIAGDGVSIGYHNRPNLTEQKFIENIFDSGYRGYCSGDLARWLPNGTIEYLGRKDNQVKIRGYRIELEDIESKLMSFDAISNAVVLVEEKDEDKEMIAYVVGDKNLSDATVQEYLSNKIPEYMIPKSYVLLNEIPLTINGKADKEKLIEQGAKKLRSGIRYKAPETAIEKQISVLWEEILGKEKIGVLDDFFALGGHSLKAIRLINEYYKRLDTKLTLKQLFDNRTLESHAALLSASKKSEFAQIQKVEPQDTYPVSDGQRRIWMLSQFEESAMAYNMPDAIELDGAYTPSLLSKAIKNCIARHEILRTVYELNEAGELRQKVLPVGEDGFELQFLDFRNENDKTATIEKHIEIDKQQKFDLSKGPLLRATLYQIEDEKYIFYYNVHHIAGDSWSFDILKKEVFESYKALLKGEKADFPTLSVQYKDYASWQLKQLSSDALADQKEYWTKKLAGELPQLALNNGRQRPKIKTYNGKSLHTYLSPEFVKQLKQFCRESEGSLFIGLFSLWNILISKYTSSNDLIIGTPVSCRNHSDLEHQIGFYLNTLPLRNTIDTDNSFMTIFNEIKANTLEAYKNQSYPFDRLVEDLHISKDVSRTPVFDMMFTLQQMDSNSRHADVVASKIHQITDTGFSLTKFDIDISFFDFGDHLALSMNYNTDIYEQFFIENLIQNFIFLSTNILVNLTEKVENIPYISDTEKYKVLEEFNTIDSREPSPETILDLFRKQVSTNNHTIALHFGNTSYTYKALDEVSNQFARFLQTEFLVSENDIVGIQLDRSEWLVISILAILKTGAAYVPISPAMPEERMEYIKEDSQYLFCISSVEIENFKKESDQFAKEELVAVDLNSTDLCYVIYTSGTTGNPKGVMVNHANLVSFLSNMDTRFALKTCATLAVTTNVTFDISILEIIGGLCTGKELFLFSDAILLDPEEIIQTIDTYQIEALQLTPSRLAQLYDTNLPLPNSLKVVLVGGEAMSKTMYEKLKQEDFASINVYGPTETTIWSTSLSIKESESLTIGTPLENERIFILNDQNKLQPIGMVGELCIGGEGVSMGYLKKPELTRTKFIENPWIENQRLYKTGDMARWKEDGTIEFFGRIDDQVKIRGHRIELGEIENALLRHAAIKGATVLIKENKKEEKDIVAYIMSDEKLNVTGMRSHLSTILPAYMIPANYMQVESFPLTSSGKVDRNKLRSYSGDVLSASEKYEAPRNEHEEKLITILASHLDREPSKISIHDNFFDLGINSLKMIKIVSQINKELAIDLKVVSLFEYPNVYKLSEYFHTMDATEEDQEESSTISQDLDEILDLF